MTTQWISVTAKDGGEFDAYLALPPTGSGPGIVLIQEIFGVNAHIQSVARQYASDGYVVLAPDLFWRSEKRAELGYDGADYAHGIELMQQLDMGLAVQDIAATAKTLKARPEFKGKLASVGYCLGGRLSYLAAVDHSVDASIAYYAGGIGQLLDHAKDVTQPIQFHFGGRDAHIAPDVVDAVKVAFADHANASVEIYPDADHGFNCWARGSYNQPAAALAHGRSLVFLSHALS